VFVDINFATLVGKNGRPADVINGTKICCWLPGGKESVMQHLQLLYE
jgi:hypothetical protein